MQANGVLSTARRTIMERRPLVMTLAACAWSVKYLIELGLTHTTGAEVYGVATAALAVATGVVSLRLVTSPGRHSIATATVMALWAVVALAGIAGTVAHIVGPMAGHGPIDLRPRPVAAPLVFTLLGFVGGAAQYLRYRGSARRVREPGEE